MPIGSDVQNTTHPDKKAASEKDKRRELVAWVIKTRSEGEPWKVVSEGEKQKTDNPGWKDTKGY